MKQGNQYVKNKNGPYDFSFSTRYSQETQIPKIDYSVTYSGVPSGPNKTAVSYETYKHKNNSTERIQPGVEKTRVKEFYNVEEDKTGMHVRFLQKDKTNINYFIQKDKEAKTPDTYFLNPLINRKLEQPYKKDVSSNNLGIFPPDKIYPLTHPLEADRLTRNLEAFKEV